MKSNITIVDYETIKDSDSILSDIVEIDYDGRILEYMVKDYGVKVFCYVPEANLSGLKRDLLKNKNFSYDI